MKRLLLLSCLTFLCGCAALGNKGLETGDIGFTPLKEAQIANTKAGRDAKGLEIHSEGGVGIVWIAIVGFLACGWIATAGFTAIVRNNK